MGLFYVDTSSNNNLENHKRHLDEIRKLAKESLKLGELASNNIFPEFLWKPQLNDHGNDDYKLRGTCSNPNVIKAYGIRRKYSNYWDYIDAMEAYYDYVEYIDSAYGSFEMMKNAADNDMSIIYIPKKPKLTNKKSNKNLLRSGFIPSRIIEDFDINAELVQDAIEGIQNKELSDDENYKLPKNIAKLHAKEESDRIKYDRINSIYARNSSGYMQGMDAIIQFLNSPNTDTIENRGRKYDSFTDEMNSLHEFDYVPQDVLDDMFEPRSTFISHAYINTPEKQRQAQILSALVNAGFVSFFDSSATRGMPKDAVRAARSNIRYLDYENNNYDNLSPKEIKKLKKKAAKKKKESRDRIIGDRRMQNALLQNRIRLSLDDSINFRLCDVIPEED